MNTSQAENQNFVPIAFHTNQAAKKELENAVHNFKRHTNELLKYLPLEEIKKIEHYSEKQVMDYLKDKYIVANGIDKQFAHLKKEKVLEMVEFPKTELKKWEMIASAIDSLKNVNHYLAKGIANYQVVDGKIEESEKFKADIKEYGISYTQTEEQNKMVALLKKLQAVLVELNLQAYSISDIYMKTPEQFNCHLFNTYFENTRQPVAEWNISKRAIEYVR